jgi:hypothetical protein
LPRYNAKHGVADPERLAGAQRGPFRPTTIERDAVAAACGIDHDLPRHDRHDRMTAGDRWVSQANVRAGVAPNHERSV